MRRREKYKEMEGFAICKLDLDFTEIVFLLLSVRPLSLSLCCPTEISHSGPKLLKYFRRDLEKSSPAGVAHLVERVP